MNRKTDARTAYFPKSDRFSYDPQGWWVQMREGILGPYPSKSLAAAAFQVRIVELEKVA